MLVSELNLVLFNLTYMCVLRTRPALCGVRIKDQTSAVWSVLCIKDQTSAVRSVLCVVSVPPLARLHPQDCAEIYRRGIVENGFYTIQPALQRPALEARLLHPPPPLLTGGRAVIG